MAVLPRPIRCTVFTPLLVVLSCLLWAVSASVVPVSSYPLAVRNPYLSAWLPGNLAKDAPSAQPQFWEGQNLTWPILARVNDQTYALFGAPGGVSGATPAEHTVVVFTATKTSVSVSAGGAAFILDFFSPVSPTNYVRQSLPYSYLTVTVLASSNPNVQIFSAIDQTWHAGAGLTDHFDTAGNTLIHSIYPKNQNYYTEKDNMAAYGTAIFASQPVDGPLSYQSGSRESVLQAFTSTGNLPNKTSAYAAGNLWGFASDLGTVGHEGKVARFAIGFDRIHAINFLGKSYSEYSRSKYPDIPGAAKGFLDDFDSAYAEAQLLDAKVGDKGAAISSNYTDLLALSLRQIYGAMELVIPTDSLDTKQALAFNKEISSAGFINTVDVIYPTLPALYLISPDWLQLLVKPHLLYLNTGGWPHPYIPHDLGGYPKALGHNDGHAEDILIEATASFFVLIQLYQHRTGASNAWLTPYRQKLYAAGDWLVKNGLYPPSQRSTVDAIPATANQTGLAQSAAIGLKALGAALNLQNYTTQGADFGKKIYPDLGTNSASHPTHFTYNYGLSSSWVTTFDLTIDQVLGLNTFPTAAATMQAQWYSTQFLPSGGITYSYNVDFVVTEWLFWAAALSQKFAAGQNIQGRAIALLHEYVTNGLNNVPFPTKFNVRGSNVGLYIRNRARSTVGSVWMPMLLNGDWGMGISE